MTDVWIVQNESSGALEGAFGPRKAAAARVSELESTQGGSYRTIPLNITEPKVIGNPAQAQVVEKIVDRVVEVPVEVEKIVYRDAPSGTTSGGNAALLIEALSAVQTMLEGAKAPRQILDAVNGVIDPAMESYNASVEEQNSVAQTDPETVPVESSEASDDDAFDFLMGNDADSEPAVESPEETAADFDDDALDFLLGDEATDAPETNNDDLETALPVEDVATDVSDFADAPDDFEAPQSQEEVQAEIPTEDVFDFGLPADIEPLTFEPAPEEATDSGIAEDFSDELFDPFAGDQPVAEAAEIATEESETTPEAELQLDEPDVETEEASYLDLPSDETNVQQDEATQETEFVAPDELSPVFEEPEFTEIAEDAPVEVPDEAVTEEFGPESVPSPVPAIEHNGYDRSFSTESLSIDEATNSAIEETGRDYIVTTGLDSLDSWLVADSDSSHSA